MRSLEKIVGGSVSNDRPSAGYPSEDIGFSIKYMDQSVDPFDDFYRYSCGNWIKTYPIPEDKAEINSFLQAEDKNYERLRAIVESCVNGRWDKGSKEQKVSDLYYSFMNVDMIEKYKFGPMKPMLDMIDGVQDFKQMSRVITEFQKKGIDLFFHAFSDPDFKDNKFYSLYIYQGGLSLPEKRYYLSDEYSELLERFKLHVKKVFLLYGLNDEDAERCKDSVIKVQTYLAKASRGSEELVDTKKFYNRFTETDLRKRYKNLDLVEIYRSLGVSESAFRDRNVEPFIVIGQPEFMGALDKILETVTIDDIKSHMKFVFLNASAEFLHSDMKEEYFDFYGGSLMGQKTQRLRWKDAIDQLNISLTDILGEMYIKQNFSEMAERRLELMLDDLKSVFRKKLEETVWMGEDTKRKAILKLDKLSFKIGHPKTFLDYSNLEIDRGILYQNLLRSAEFEVKDEIERVGKPIDEDEWPIPPQSADAINSANENKMFFSAGILQPPFFDVRMDDAVNYGGIGFVIAHEMTHNFDSEGRKFDEKGNLRNWWSKEDAKKFNVLANKIKEFYGSLEILPGVKVNGAVTLSEDIADLGAVSIVYDALERRLSLDSSRRKKIDGFTPEQRLFISMSQLWKENITQEGLKYSVVTDSHSPAMIRGLIPIVSHPKFEEAFRDKSRLGKMKQRYPNLSIW